MKTAYESYRAELAAIREAGTYKDERIITTPQKSRIDTTAAHGVVNMCANNYLGLSNHPRLIEAAKKSYDDWGFGLSSVRFICGTQEIHKTLERKIADFVGMEDAILYSSCFDANGGLFETLLGADDAVISDELNHASIIDGVRLCKAHRYRYKNSNMDDLRAQLMSAREAGCKKIIIATDGVFSMDGYIANLKGICDLADEFDALVMVDEAYFEFADESAAKLLDEYENLLILHTFSKAYRCAGIRLGYFLGNPNVISEFKKVRQPYSVDAISQIVGEEVVRNRELFDESIEQTRVERDRLIAALSQLDKVTVYPSEANFVMLKLPFAMSVWSNLDEKHSVLVRNVSGENHLAGCLRVTVGTPEENDRFLDALTEELGNLAYQR